MLNVYYEKAPDGSIPTINLNIVMDEQGHMARQLESLEANESDMVAS